jgi:hypothetical protein
MIAISFVALTAFSAFAAFDRAGTATFEFRSAKGGDCRNGKALCAHTSRNDGWNNDSARQYHLASRFLSHISPAFFLL